MQRLLRATLRGALRALFKGVIGRPIPVRLARIWMEIVTATTLPARGTHRERGVWGVIGERVTRRDAQPGRALLYLHGGGYTLGSPNTHKVLTTHFAAVADCEVLAPDYRLAPEHPYPAAMEDAISAYRALLDRFPARRIGIGGDSAGGGLALSTVLALRDAGLPAPAALLLISPWVDLTLSGASVETQAQHDPLLSRDWLTRAAEAYRGTVAPNDTQVSPLFADLRGLPPTLIQVGSDEILLDDARRLAECAKAAGVEVTLEIEAGYWHDFQVHARMLDASDAAIARISNFLDHHWIRP